MRFYDLKQSVLIFVFLFSATALSQSLHWVNTTGNANGDSGKFIEVDGNNNLYASSSFLGSIDVDPSSIVTNVSSAGAKDGILQKFDTNGDLIWANKFGGTGNDEILSLCFDQNNNVYIVGSFESTVDADWGSGTTNITSTSGSDSYIAKYDENGLFQWVKTINSSGDVKFSDVHYDTSGVSDHLILSGYYEGTADFDPGVAVNNKTASGTKDVFALKLTNTGNFVWVKTVEGVNNQEAKSVKVDGNGNVYLSGNFNGSIDSDPGASVNTLSTSGNWDGYFIKLNSLGDYQWSYQIGSNGIDKLLDMDVNVLGEVYTTGFYRNTCDLDPTTGTQNETSGGADDIFIQKMDAQGNFIWAKTFTGSGSNKGNGISVSETGEVLVAGFFSSTCDLDPSTNTLLKSSNGGNDIFYSSLSSNGDLDYVFTTGSSSPDKANNITSKNGVWYVAGYFQSNVDFDPTPSILNKSSSGSFDAFYMKIDPCRNYSSMNITACNSYSGPSGNYNWNTTGTYLDTLSNSNGCDSVVSVNLTIVSAIVNDIVLEECNGFSTVVNGNTYNSTGYYTEIINGGSVWGCDSIINLDLTIHQENTGIDVQTACDSYTWIDGVNYTSSNNSATYILTNIAGCDSTVTLDLTINNSVLTTETVVNCGAYTWPVNGTQYVLSGIYTHTLQTVTGCDSVLTLDLTVNPDYTNTMNVEACDSYTWSVNGSTYSVSGVYSELLQSVSGCDSTVVLDLVINNSFATTQVVESCGAYTWPADGNEYTSSGNYSTTLSSQNGCDSVVTLDLEIVDLDLGINAIGNGVLSSNDGQLTSTFQWLDCNDNFNPINGEDHVSFTPIANGSYAVEVSNDFCVDTSNCFLLTNLGINNNLAFDIELFPNPNKGQFYLAFESAIDVELSLFNSQGQLVKKVELRNSKEYSFDMSKETIGVYYLFLKTDQGINHVKIMKD